MFLFSEKILAEDMRASAGFHDKADWCNQKAHFTEKSLKIGGHRVIEKWQSDYMKMLADIVCIKGGRILEIGYGMGIASEFIQKNHNISDHIIIECHPDVITKCRTDYAKEIQSGEIILKEGFWEDITSLFSDNSFDGILFDTYPLNKEEVNKNQYFFFDEAFRLLKSGGIFTYYSDEITQYSEEHLLKLRKAGFNKINSRICHVRPPGNCSYWTNPAILAPIVIKT